MKRMRIAVFFCLIFCTGALLLTGCSRTQTVGQGTVACTALSGKKQASVEISESLTLDFTGDEKANQTFNRVDLEYTLTGPVRGDFVYSMDGKTQTEEFYLTEKSESFSQLLDGYLLDNTAGRLQAIHITPLDGTVTFCLKSIALVNQQVFPEVLSLENERYRLGIKLSWGGGISCLEDLQATNKNYTNLLNCHDTGRLVQQSYYGAAQDENYQNGSYNGVEWPYNPVQGGDLHGNRSKIVAVTVSDNTVTVVSRPLDWARNNCYTMAYYTNIYTLQDDCIRVENTIVDFSNLDHIIRAQELPAFYVISALKNFVCYTGSAPWSGDGLTVEENLGFWGTGEAGNTFGLSPSNTESWCAWVDGKNYGIGLFTPAAELFTAGRYQYNGTADSSANATNYVAPVASLQLPYNDPLSYSYLICCGSVEQIRNCFTANKDFCDNASLRQPLAEAFDFTHITFEGEEDLAYFSSPNQTALSYENGCAVLTANQKKSDDPYISLRYAQNQTSLQAEDYDRLVIVYRTGEQNKKASDICELFFAADTLRQATGGYSKRFALQMDGQFHAEILPLDMEYWRGRINLIRLDYFAQASQGDAFYLYSMTLAKGEKEAQRTADRLVAAAEKTLG